MYLESDLAEPLTVADTLLFSSLAVGGTEDAEIEIFSAENS